MRTDRHQPPRASKWALHLAQLTACLLAPALASAGAQTTEFQVVGAIIGHCRITTEDVALEYRASDFTGIGSDQKWFPFNVTAAGCDDGIGTTLHIAMTGAVDTVDSTLFAVSGVSGVGLQIQTADGRAVNPDGSAPPQWNREDVGHAYPYRARFMQQSTAVTAGTGRATVVVTVSVD